MLSLVIPAYRQQKTIAKELRTLRNSLEEIGIPFEIIVIVDGRVDKTYENARKLSSTKIRVFGYEKNRGKGHAVKYGVEKTKGDVVGFIDAGMDIDPAGIQMLLNHMLWYDADVIVGSKLHPVSQVKYPFYRKILSWGYRNFTHFLFGFKVRDTQVGLKVFKSKVAKDVFPRLLVKRFAFDVEMLALAHALGYKRIYEAPIKLNFRGMSTIASSNLWKTVGLMLLDTFAIYYRIRILKYYRKSNKKNWL